jgi:hypothetical protein
LDAVSRVSSMFLVFFSWSNICWLSLLCPEMIM